MLGGICGNPVSPALGAGDFAAARLAEDGGAAGVSPAMATGCGVDCADGNTGSAERATADASGAPSCFQNAQRGPDWQPHRAANITIVINVRTAFRVMSMEP